MDNTSDKTIDNYGILIGSPWMKQSIESLDRTESSTSVTDRIRLGLQVFVGEKTMRLLLGSESESFDLVQKVAPAKRFVLAILSLITLTALVALSPWYSHRVFYVSVALLKPVGLALSVVFSAKVALRLNFIGTHRFGWTVLSVGLGFLLIGQLVIAFHQVILHEAVPYPSIGDLFFVMSYVFILWGLFSFCSTTYQSSIIPDRFFHFYWPAAFVMVSFGTFGYWILSPITESSEGLTLVLNLLYPIAGWIELAPCAVVFLMATRFRGGLLLYPWLLLTLGFACSLLADIFFSYLTSFSIAWVEPLVDVLYLASYLLIPAGIFFQLCLVEPNEEPA